MCVCVCVREISCYMNCTHVEISHLTKHALVALPQCIAKEIHWPIHPDHPDATGNLVPCLSYCQHNERRHHSYAGQTKAVSEGQRKGQGGTRDTVSVRLKWGITEGEKGARVLRMLQDKELGMAVCPNQQNHSQQCLFIGLEFCLGFILGAYYLGESPEDKGQSLTSYNIYGTYPRICRFKQLHKSSIYLKEVTVYIV